jgi:polyhydroxyalkanoate synthase
MKAQRVSKPGNPDRRLAPRPLPIHLASAMSLWLSSRAALPILKYVSLRSSLGGERACRLADEIEELGPDKVAAALDGEIIRRAELYLSGLESYRRHPFRRRVAAPTVLWRSGATRLLDYGRDTAGPAVFVVPSLINRYYVLDILPERSFLRHLAGQGLRPLVVDWGAPGKREQTYGLSDYVTGPLDQALTAAARVAGSPIGIVGYCMGGLFSLALALRRQDEIGCLALLATPWDFHADSAQRAQMFADTAGCLLRSCGEQNMVPVEMIQSFFFMLDPFAAERKFTRFAALTPDGDEARSFVALEDWLNDGVPLSGRVAHECTRFWYGENLPGRSQWRVGGQPIDPRLIRRPALVVFPRRDRIVPPDSAKLLAAQLPDATVIRPPLGHVGMMSAARAPQTLWTPIADWLRVQLGSPKP